MDKVARLDDSPRPSPWLAIINSSAADEMSSLATNLPPADDDGDDGTAGGGIKADAESICKCCSDECSPDGGEDDCFATKVPRDVGLSNVPGTLIGDEVDGTMNEAVWPNDIGMVVGDDTSVLNVELVTPIEAPETVA